MKSSSNKTIKYYNDNAEQFCESTRNLDMSEFYQPFLKLLPRNGSILDAGCGSGRDSLYFLNHGYRVTPFDASDSMVELSSKLLGLQVMKLDLDNVDFSETFNGIWACAVFLHIPKDRMKSIICRMEKALINKGVMFASLKHGQGEQQVGDRFFSYYTEKSFTNLLCDFPTLKIINMWKTKDIRTDKKNTIWLNVIVRKIQQN